MSDPGDDTLARWALDWGDGMAEMVTGNPPSATHLFDGPGTYRITGSASDEDGTYPIGNTVVVTATDVAPTLTITGAASVAEGAWYTLNLSASDPGLDTIGSWTIDWGDAISETLAGDPSVALHRYADGGNDYTISVVSASDEDGVYTSDSTVDVHVEDVEAVLTVTDRDPVTEGSPYTLTLGIVDPGADLVSEWEVSWGDGLTETVPGGEREVTHVYTDNDDYVVDVTAVQDNGLDVTTGLTATVQDQAPRIDLLDGQHQWEAKQPFVLTLGALTDPGDDTVTEYRVYWGDNSVFSAVTPTGVVTNPYETLTTTTVVEHVYPDWELAYDVRVGVVDEDGVHSAAGSITVVPEGKGEITDTAGITRTVAVPLAVGRLFTVTLDYQAELDAGAVSSVLRQAFADHGIVLTTTVTVTTVVAGIQWQLDDAGETYTILDQGGWLGVHRDPHYLVAWGDGISDTVDCDHYAVVSDTLKLSARHIYESQGVYTMRVCIMDRGDPAELRTQPVVVNNIPDVVYVPVAMQNYVPGPDLVVERIVATGMDIQVVVKNRGDRPVSDEFWVDVYIDPHTVPTAVNQMWDMMGSQGLVWGITSAALPLEPGGVITLTVGDTYYWQELSRVLWPLAAGTPVYAQVDSANDDTTYGAVLENHEIGGWGYNNIRSALSTRSDDD